LAKRALSALIASGWLAFALPSDGATAPDVSEAAQTILAVTNAFRHEHEQPALTGNAQLANAARYFADYMAKTDHYGHSADGSEPDQRAQKFGYDYCAVAENIAYQFKSTGFSTRELAERFFEGWRNSPGHRKNMLDPDVTETAIAIARSAKTGRHYAVQLFGRPKSRTIEFSIENQTAGVIEYSFDGENFKTGPRVRRTHQHCKQTKLVFAGKTLLPRNGQQLVLVNEDGRAQLQMR